MVDLPPEHYYFAKGRVGSSKGFEGDLKDWQRYFRD
jgi:hypothetical protein